MKRICLPLLACLTLALFAGCTKEEPTTSGTTTTGSTTGGKSSTGAGKLKIVFIPKNTGNPYFNPVIDGFKKACDELGADFVSTGPAKADATSQIPIIKEQVQQGVDVLAIAPNSEDALNGALDEAKAKGIVVITVDSDLTKNESHRDASIHPTDFTKVGEDQIEMLGSMINYTGNIAILSATANAPNQNAWIATMKDMLKQPKYSKMKIIDIVYGDDDPQKSSTEFEGLLSKHPDLRGVIAPTSVGLSAAARSLQLAGNYPGGPKAVNGGLVLTGLSTPNEMKKYVSAGVVQKFELWDPKDMGYLAAQVGALIKKGTLKPMPGTDFEVPTMGKRTFGPLAVVNAGPVVDFAKDNIDKYDF